MIKEFYLTTDEIAQAVLEFINDRTNNQFPDSISEVDEITFWINENMVHLSDLEGRIRHEEEIL